MSRNWNPPRKPEGRDNGARPMRGRSRRSPRSVALAYSPSSREGRLGAGAANGRREKKFVTDTAHSTALFLRNTQHTI